METSPSTEFVPPLPSINKRRTLILCFDGTDNKISTKLSNIAQFFSLLRKDMPSNQLVYYQTGIGTYTSSNVVDPISSKIAKTMDSLFATSIGLRVKDGYDFIMQHYVDGDKICIFGFSRGGYTARALAGMIHKVGLLPRGNTRHIKYAYKVFLQTGQGKKGWDQAAEFKRCFCVHVPIEFVGIWDSVGSVGFNSPGLPFSKASTTIKTFRHALSLDEHRVLFNANAWRCHEDVFSEDPVSSIRTQSSDKGFETTTNAITTTRGILQTLEFEHQHSKHDYRTDVLEVWFAGCHSDVGGGSVETDTLPSLSRIPLRWMVLECFRKDTGILFSVPFLLRIGLNPRPNRTLPLHIPQLPVVMEGEDSKDGLSPLHDRLKSAPLWWILEVMPIRRWFRSLDGTASSFTYCNLGRPRFESSQNITGIKVHHSVKMRMESTELRYHPKAKLLANPGPTWVD